MSTSVLLRSEIDLKVQALLDEAEGKVDGLLNRKLSFLYGDKAIHALPCDTLRVITELVSDDPANQTLKNLLLNTIVTSENLWAGSGIISLLVLLESSKTFRKNRILNIDHEYDLDPLNKAVCENSRRTNSKDIFKSVQQIADSQYEIEVVKSTLDAVGSSTAHLSDKVGLHTVIASNSGYTIKVSPDDLFWTTSSASLISLFNCKVVCIDGIVESVSEIHSIMDQSFRTGQSVVLFARGFNDDVTNTLAVNHSRGKLNVIPVVVPYDMKGVNQLVDIAVCSGCDVVSSIKGELISTIEWDDLVEVEHIRITSGKTSIDNKKTISRVSSHRTNLQNKLSSTFCNFAEEGVLTEEQQVAVNENIEKQRGILHDRILSLMSSGAQITLGKEHGGSRGIRQDRISTILGMYGQSSRYGLVDLEHVTKRRIDPVADRVIKKLLNSGINSLSPPAILCAFRIGIANARMIHKIGAWLTIDE